MASTKVIFCGCSHSYQERKYGSHKRLHNEMKPNGSVKRFRCTVCGSIKNDSPSKKVEKEKE